MPDPGTGAALRSSRHQTQPGEKGAVQMQAQANGNAKDLAAELHSTPL